MPIRLRNRKGSHGKIFSVLQGVTGALTGSHDPPLVRTGTLRSTLAGVAAALRGNFQAHSNYQGTLATVLAGVSAAFRGSFATTGSPPQWTDGLGDNFGAAEGEPLAITLQATDVDSPINFAIGTLPSGFTATPQPQVGNVRQLVIATAGAAEGVYDIAVDFDTAPAASGELPVLTLSTPLTGTRPWCFGQAFKKGAVHPGQLRASAGATAFQVDVRSRWADGSIKFALLSGLTNFSGSPVAVTTALTGTLTAAANVETSALNAHLVRIDAGGVFESFGSADWGSPVRTLVQGPVMSAWTYRKPIASNAHLVAWLEVRAFSNGNVEVFPWIENGYLLVANPTNQFRTYKVTINGVERFSAPIDVKHHTRIPLLTGSVFSYWTGTDPQVTPKHDGAYLQETRLVANYGWAAPTGALLDSFQQVYTPNTLAGVNSAMGSAGGSASLLMPHGIAYLKGGDARAYRATVVHGLSSGSWSCHYRDEATQSFPRLATYPGISIGWSGTPTVPNPSGGENGTLAFTHLPTFGYFAHLITGREWFLDESAFWLNCAQISNLWTRRFYADGVLDTSEGFANRGGAWQIRNLLEVVTLAGASHPHRAEWIGFLENNARHYRVKYADGGTYTERGRAQSYAVNFGTSWVSPQGFFGEYSSSGDSAYPVAGDATGIWVGAAWMSAFSAVVWGHAANLELPLSTQGLSDLLAVAHHGFKQPVHRLGDHGFDWRRFPAYGYPVGADHLGLPCDTWYTAAQSYPLYLQIHGLSDANLQTNTIKGHSVDTNIAGADTSAFYGSILLSALAFAREQGAAGAAAAWTCVTGATNFSHFITLAADCGEYGITPR